jgi:hypothetical protein
MRSKIIALLIVLLVISMMLARLNLSAQEDDSSLSATVQFLKDNAGFIDDLGIGKPKGRKWRLESPADCTLVWTTEASDEVVPPTGNTYIDNLSRERAGLPTSVTLSLSDISNIWSGSLPAGNANVLRTNYRKVYISMTPRRNVVKWRGGEGNRDEDGLILNFKSSEMGEKYSKALRNAVTLCNKADKEDNNNSVNAQSNN